MTLFRASAQTQADHRNPTSDPKSLTVYTEIRFQKPECTPLVDNDGLRCSEGFWRWSADAVSTTSKNARPAAVPVRRVRCVECVVAAQH
jgi:anti-sigma-K factor RskA